MSGGRVVTLGETMGLLAATTVGHLQHVPHMALGIGGAESNVAIALSRLGTPVSWIGRLGMDSVGDRVVRELTAEGVDVHAVRDPDAPTGLMLKERLPGGAVKVWYYRAHGAGARLAPADVDDALVAGAGLLHVTGITPALGATASAAVFHAVDVARGAGVKVSVDVNHRSALWPPETAAPVLRRLVERADIVFAGDDEAALVLGRERADDPEELAAALTGLGPAGAVIKLGAEGASALVDGVHHRQAAVPVQVVDPVGAGDAFVGAYLSELMAGADVKRCLDTAALAGALLCTVPGDWEAMPTRAVLDGWTGVTDDVQR
ncbi:sugar kinase [Streptomyces phaeochromogenes]|uniref:sugar kinase n=1 Tax=Streptomyces phaeochromogenes TaxID=1923 RepID=UPI002E14940B|nr:sugar kinase [Streptomyces phaeochromogenes]